MALEEWKQEIVDKLAALPADPERPWTLKGYIGTYKMIRRGEGDKEECPLSAIGGVPWYDVRTNNDTVGGDDKRRLTTTYSADGNAWNKDLFDLSFREAMITVLQPTGAGDDASTDLRDANDPNVS